MRALPLKFSVPHPTFYCVTDTRSCPALGHPMDERFIKPICLKWNLSPTVLVSIVRSSQRFHRSGPFRIRAYAGEASNSPSCFQLKDPLDSITDQTNVAQINCNAGSPEIFAAENHRENERRRKIGLANKGKVPWNKGRKHSAETRERIRQKTIEALSDPKVKMKMAQHPRPHSDQIKAKIGSSLRRIWEERLKEKRLKEKFFLSWGESIAKAAKVGWSDQEKLDWDSYDKIKRELALQQLQRIEEKETAKAVAKMKAQKAAELRAEKMAMLMQKRREREEKRKQREEEKKKKVLLKKTAESKGGAVIAVLKQRLEKIHRKKSVPVQVTGHGDTVLFNMEKMDLERIRREKARTELSLADQIQAAKNMRAESIGEQALLTYTTMD